MHLLVFQHSGLSFVRRIEFDSAWFSLGLVAACCCLAVAYNAKRVPGGARMVEYGISRRLFFFLYSSKLFLFFVFAQSRRYCCFAADVYCTLIASCQERCAPTSSHVNAKRNFKL
jgi:hypothetical protein